MPKFKVIISDPKTGKSQSVDLEENVSLTLVGRRLGDIIDGSVVKMPRYKLQLRGGSDKDGFPMRPNVHGGVRVSVIVSGGVGFSTRRRGERRRKTLRGNVITEDIVQVNMKVVEWPKAPQKKSK
jgi:small subunit ribosomal protein S6e